MASTEATMFLRLVHSPLARGASVLSVRLEGTVAEAVVAKINAELAAERGANAELSDCAPDLRLERGFWEFFTTASSTYHKDILIKCFVLPITLDGWNNVQEFNAMARETNFNWITTIAGSHDATDATHIFVKHGHLEETYRPLSGMSHGGGGCVVKYNPIGSVAILCDTAYYDLHADGPMSMFGFGWDAARNPVYGAWRVRRCNACLVV